MTDDDEWKAEVRNYVSLCDAWFVSSQTQPAPPGLRIRRQQIIDYLWSTVDTYKRLAETDEGRFVRELAAPVPDLLLRSMYRKRLRQSKF